jgi:hypothetical protein
MLSLAPSTQLQLSGENGGGFALLLGFSRQIGEA